MFDLSSISIMNLEQISWVISKFPPWKHNKYGILGHFINSSLFYILMTLSFETFCLILLSIYLFTNQSKYDNNFEVIIS